MGLTSSVEQAKQIDILMEIQDEFQNARLKFKPMRGPHEGYAVILEEFEEMWDEIKKNDREETRKEAIQVGAMILAFILEVCDAY
jgi:hypothetical protein